MAKKQTKTRY